jgi:hypothetical protein
MSQVASWRPKFPDPQPSHWLAVVATGADQATIVSDVGLDESQREWLARWLQAHNPREPEAEASYIYIGLGPNWSSHTADGMAAPDSVTGVGWGIGFGEPEGASRSTVEEILRLSLDALKLGPGA